MLVQLSGIISRSEINYEHDDVPPPPPPPTPPPPPAEPSPNPSAEGWRKKLIECLKYPNKWSEDDRGLLMVVATMISTMTFQAVANPPGGVWQENNTNTSFLLKDGSNYTVCSEEYLCVAGTAVLGHVFPTEFLRFIKFNTISFLASLSVILLLVSGCPLHNRICMWLLSMALCVTLTFMALTYLQVLLLVVVPFGDLYKSSDEIYKICFNLWIGLLVMVSVMITIRFLIWVVKKSRPAYSGLQKIIRNRSFGRNV